MISGLTAEEHSIVKGTIEMLEGFGLTETMTRKVTHIVCGGKRTEKVVEGIARGLWIVSFEWILASTKANEWMSEEKYEMADVFPGAKVSRVRMKEEKGFQLHNKPNNSVLSEEEDDEQLFSIRNPIYVCESTKPSKRFLEHIVTLSGGKVAFEAAFASVVVGCPPRRVVDEGVAVVREKWVIDTVATQKRLPHEQYVITNIERKSLREEASDDEQEEDNDEHGKENNNNKKKNRNKKMKKPVIEEDEDEDEYKPSQNTNETMDETADSDSVAATA
eukprot:m.159249 g.159249  ORF g.159249 m.159249 type:complete len:276 (+) comp13366_c4_seq3:1842-2669(+)